MQRPSKIMIVIIQKVLKTYGFEGQGNEVLYSGITGEQLKTQIFMGPIYYQRIKIMVADKMHSRGTGPVPGINKTTCRRTCK